MRRKTRIRTEPFTDLLFNTLLGFTFLFFITNWKTDKSDAFSKEERGISLLINILSLGQIMYMSGQLLDLAKHILD